MWLCVLGSALATPGLSGLGVPGPGGLIGPAERGALGAFDNPASAVRAEGTELLLDVGLLRADIFVALDEVPEVNGSTTQFGPPQPAISVAVPLGRFGLSGAIQVPFARFSNQPADGPTRQFGYSSNVVLVEADLMGSWAPHERISLGAGLRLGALPGFRNFSAIDTGALINEALEPDPPLPVGDPLLEGDLQIRGFGFGASWMVGASAVLPGDVELHATFRPPWTVPVHGSMMLAPSRDLRARIQGDLTLDFPFPHQLGLAARVPIGRFAILPEVEWVGWGRAGRIGSRPSSLKLVTDDPLWNGVLEASGLVGEEVLGGLAAESVEDLQWHDIVILGGQVEWATEWSARPLVLRAGVWHAPRVMETRVTSVGNLDFGTVTVRAAASLRAVPALEVVPGFDYIHSPRVRVTDSPSDGVLPAGNGVYDLDGWRLNVNLLWRPGASR